MRMFIYGFMTIGLWVADSAQAEVYRCEDPEQGVVFQQTPCPEPEAGDEADGARDPEEAATEAPEAAFASSRPVVGRDEDVADVVAREQEQQKESAAIRACKQKYRDAIDAIDLEIQNSYTPEQKEYYLERLKALTDKMKEC